MSRHITARSAAALAGQYLFQGRPCRHNHHPLRYTASGECRDCRKAHSRNRYQRLCAAATAVTAVTAGT